ncbi:MAG: hypothetical protein ACK514_18075 [Bacteroidota bacterium]|jgi:hypothetical protein|nr:hypothetical protein [Cytophagales bacterium]MCE2957429.1 hypothetical protein [Flammeovirgaceae bacterium]MCZ8069715.1 hypothetical protein [Cytophagales bacterium]
MKNALAKLPAVCCIFALGALLTCSKDEQIAPLPPLVISGLQLDQPYYIISNLPTFNISGTLAFSGARGGIKTLRVTSDLGIDESVVVNGVSQENGQLVGVFTLQMISNPGRYGFTIWVVDGARRESNKLNGFFEMIEDPNKRPTPVQLITANWDNNQNATKLVWTKNTNSDFSAYVIKRHYPLISRYGVEESAEVARVFDSNVTSTFDLETNGVGFNFSYSVSVSNGKYLSESNRVTVTYPYAHKLLASAQPAGRPIFSSTGDRIYFINDESYFGRTPTIKAISTQSNAEVNSFDLAGFSPYLPLALSKDDSKLYTVMENNLIALHAASFTVSLNTALDFYSYSVACGRSNRLYLVAYAPASEKGKVKILDASNATEVGKIEITDVQMRSVIVSADGNTLYSVGQKIEAGLPVGMLKVFEFDVSTDIPNLLNVRDAADQVSIQLSPNGDKLFVEQHYFPSTNTVLDVWNATSLQSVAQFDLTNKQGYLINNDTPFGYNFKRDADCPSGYYYQLELLSLVPGSLPKFWSYFSGWSGDTGVMLVYSKDFKSIYLFDQHRSVYAINLLHD